MPVANPLTLIMDIKSPEDSHALKELIDGMQGAQDNPIRKALSAIGTVHYARFVFLSEKQLAVITTYDDSFDDYIQSFATAIGPIFDALLVHMCDAPPLPVSEHRLEFLRYVKERDLRCVEPFYCAYPELRVQDILTLQREASS